MPRRHKRGGSVWDSMTSSMTNLGSSMSNWGSSLMSSSKKTPSYSSSSLSLPSSSSSSSSYQPSSYSSSTTLNRSSGGKRRSKRRMRGGFKDNTPLNNLAAKAAPFSGSTAEPKNWVGGKTKRRRGSRKNRRSKSHRHH
jgi:hypothetical protein